jgi:hypothetical protein
VLESSSRYGKVVPAMIEVYGVFNTRLETATSQRESFFASSKEMNLVMISDGLLSNPI